MSNTEEAVLLDSVILIDLLNGIEKAQTYLQSVRRNAVLSVITRAEVLAGTTNPKNERVARRLLDRFPCFPLTAEPADRAASRRPNRGHFSGSSVPTILSVAQTSHRERSKRISAAIAPECAESRLHGDQ